MRIRHLSIENFRGIRELQWAIPDKQTVCLIGRGDSTKSTILEALRRLFHPHWSLGFDDSDFFNCDPANRLRIEALLGVLPDEFHDLENYAQRMSGWDTESLTYKEDPGVGLDAVLRIRLLVDDDLQPSWMVVKGDEDDGVMFRAADRSRVSVNLIGAAYDRDLTWSRGSLLTRLTKGENIPAILAEAGRAARASLEQQRSEGLAKFDEVAASAEKAAKDLGVRVSEKYAANLDSDGMNLRLGGLAIHDGRVPLRQLGLGSKRILTTGLQRHGLDRPHITLIDEVEHGLEPHRLARLIDYIKSDEKGQYFVTTHSPVALREFEVADLHVVHAFEGKTEVVAAARPNFSGSIQGKIRTHAEALLAPRIVVCEGATEAGFLRGWDGYWSSSGNKSFAYQGVALLDAKGASKVRGIAEELDELGYSIAVLADADDLQQFGEDDVAALKKRGATVVVWEDSMCVEQRVFADAPWPAVVASVRAAYALYGDDRVRAQVRIYFKGEELSADPSSWLDTRDLRDALGMAANKSAWFKSISKGREWIKAICTSCDVRALDITDLGLKLEQLRAWIDRA